MNERINELAMKANSHHNNFFDLNYKELDVFLETFAELMLIEFTEAVKETAILVAQTAYNDGESKAEVDQRVNSALRVLDVMSERLGVEE